MQKTFQAMLCSFAILLSSGAGALEFENFTVTAVPEGDQPAWVRQAWVGLALPYEYRKPCLPAGTGKKVLTSPGYVVRQFIALELLMKRSPKAAAWWWEHGYGTDRNRGFCFSPESAELPL